MIPIFYRKTDRKGNILFGMQFLLTIPMIGLAVLALYSSGWLLEQAHTALEIISGYLTWYRVLLWGGLLLTIAALFLHILIFVKLKKAGSFAPQHIYMALLSLILICIFTVFMPISEEVPSLIRDAKSDIAAIENNQLVVATGQLNAEVSSRGLPGPYREGAPAPVAKANLKPIDEEFFFVYLPVDMKTVTAGGSQYFDIVYTPKLNVVVEIIPAENA